MPPSVMPPGFTPYPVRRSRDRLLPSILDMLSEQSKIEYAHAMNEAQRSGDKWRSGAELIGSVYPAYQELKAQRRAEDDRQRAIERTTNLDLIAAEERAQAQRDLDYDVALERIEKLSGLDQDVIAASLGDTLQTRLPGPPSSTDPLYLPEMPLTDPEREERVGPRLFTGSQAVPQGRPKVHLAEIASRIEGETELIPVPTLQQADRARYMAEQKERSLARFKAGLVTEERLDLEEKLIKLREKHPGASITTVRVGNPSGGEDVIFIDQNVWRKPGATPEDAELGRITGSAPPETRPVPTQTSMIDQADAGLARVLAGQDPGEFAFDRLRDRTKDPLHLDALSEGFRSRESRVYKNYLSSKLAVNPAMAALNPRSPRGAHLPPLKLDEFNEWEGQVFSDFLEGVERYLQGPADEPVSLFFTNPKDGLSYPVPAEMAEGLSHGDVLGDPDSEQSVRVYAREREGEWPSGLSSPILPVD